MEKINGENILDFQAILDSKLDSFIDDTSVFELDNDYFDVAFFKKISNEDGTFTVEVESEHVSYRLNRPEYNIECFTEIGTPVYVLSKILDKTEFSIGTVDFTTSITFSAQEPKSRRQLLMEFVALLGGEISFNKFTVDILTHRGSTTAKKVIKDRNIKVVSKTVDKREFDSDGKYKVTYSCTPICLPNELYTLGDDILLIQKQLGINEYLRVVSLNYNPYSMDVALEFSNYTNGLEDNLYRIITSTVVKDKLYNGCRIGPEFGFEAIRNDKKARAYFRSDGLAMQTSDGKGTAWRDRLYYYYDSKKDETTLVYDGKLSVDLLNTISGIISPYIYSENGAIVNALVRRLRTDLSKPFRYLYKDTSDVQFQDIGDTENASGRYFEVDYCQIDSPPVQFSTPSIEGSEKTLLWWFEGRVGESMTTNPAYAVPEGETDPVPVMVYQYTNTIQHKEELFQDAQGAWSVRSQWGEETFGSSGIIEKTPEFFQMIIESDNANVGGIRIGLTTGVQLFNPVTKDWEYPGKNMTPWYGTQAEYDSLPHKEPDKQYFIESS